MTLDEAKVLLAKTKRETVSSQAFGDCEVYWMRGEEEIADGYFSLSVREVNIQDTRFTDDDADELRYCGEL